MKAFLRKETSNSLIKKIAYLYTFWLVLVKVYSQEFLDNKEKFIDKKINTEENKKFSNIKFLDLDFERESKNEKIMSSLNQKERENELERHMRILQTSSSTTTNAPTSSSGTTSNTTTDSTTEKYQANKTYIVNPECTSDFDCSLNGACNSVTKTCTCKAPFVTIYNNSTAVILKTSNNATLYTYPTQKMCNYEQKKQLTAFMLSIFVGFGAEHFYLDNSGVGVAKCVFYIFCGFLNVLYLIFYKCVPGGEKYVSFIHSYEALYLACGVGYMLLWNIYDWVNIGFNDQLDGKGVRLSPWGV